LSSSSHLPLNSYSNELNPVMLPPGRARLSTYPAPTGLDVRVAAVGPAQLQQRLYERRVASLPFWIVRGRVH